MATPKFIEIDGKRSVWRDVLQLRREQKQVCASAVQPALFELQEDRPTALRPHGGRITRPSGGCRSISHTFLLLSGNVRHNAVDKSCDCIRRNRRHRMNRSRANSCFQRS